MPSQGCGGRLSPDAAGQQPSRYLYDIVETYAERLLWTFPEALFNVTFPCTGSEANDLALRLARCATRATGIVVKRGDYHGNTASVTEVSPSSYKKGSPPPYIKIIDAPDPRLYGPDLAAGFTGAVAAAIEELREEGHGFAALLVNTIFSSDGVYADPPGFLGSAAEVVRREGGMFIADEVQPGFGRTGDSLWGFQRHGFVPDIVTLGKPIGNGVPIGAVISRPGYMALLNAQYGYFNTFVGAALVHGLAGLAKGHDRIVAVRGCGLYVDVEIATPAGGTSANEDPTGQVVNALRQRGVLIGIAGTGANVLKIRPPLRLSYDNAGYFVEQLAEIITE